MTFSKFFFPAVIVLLYVSSIVQGQEVIPSTDDDLAAIGAQLSKISEMTDDCFLTNGPKINCSASQAYFQDVRDARAYIQHLDYWLRYARQIKLNNFVSGLGDDHSDKYKAILHVQATVIDGANYAELVQTVRNGLNDLKRCYEEVNETSLPQFDNAILRLRRPLERLQAAEDSFIGNNLVSESIPELDNGFTQNDFKDLISTLNDAKESRYAAHRDGKKWRKELRNEEHADPVIESADRLLALYTDELAQTRKTQIDELIQTTDGLDDSQKEAFTSLKRINVRSQKVTRLFEHMDFLVVFNSKTGSGRLTSCYLKLNEQCGVLDLNYVSRVEMPEAIKVEDFKVDSELKGDDDKWEAPVMALNKKLADVGKMLTGAPEIEQIEVVASLNTDTTTVKARGRIKVKFKAMYHFHPKSWIGWVPSDVPHGFAGNNAANSTGKRITLRRMETGELEFKAPKKPGKYDLRMNDVSSGREVASISIEVVEAPKDEPAKKDKESKADEKTEKDSDKN